MSILNEICAMANNLLKNNVVIGVAGAGCIGKTTFSHQLVSFLHPQRAVILSLDSYMLEREAAYKIQPGMTGYDIRRNDLEQASKDIAGLLSGEPLFLMDYDRNTHTRNKKQVINPKPFIIIDGVHALNDKILPFIDIGIFFDATEEVQYKLRLKREKEEFGYDEIKVKERWAKYWPDYKNYIEPQKSKADLVLKVSEDYSLEVVE